MSKKRQKEQAESVNLEQTQEETIDSQIIEQLRALSDEQKQKIIQLMGAPAANEDKDKDKDKKKENPDESPKKKKKEKKEKTSSKIVNLSEYRKKKEKKEKKSKKEKPRKPGVFKKVFRFIRKDREQQVLGLGASIDKAVGVKDTNEWEQPATGKEVGKQLAKGFILNPIWNIYKPLRSTVNMYRGLIRGVVRPLWHPVRTFRNPGKYALNWARVITTQFRYLRDIFKRPISVVDSVYNSTNNTLKYISDRTLSKIPLIRLIPDKIVFPITKGVGKVITWVDHVFAKFTGPLVKMDKYIAERQNAADKAIASKDAEIIKLPKKKKNKERMAA